MVLRRYVSEIERIISIAPFAVVYIFSPETQQWEKSGTEGTLFVCQLSGARHPRYNVVILNRKSLENFITELVSEDDIEITEQYVILQVQGESELPTIYGLWIFSDEGESVHSTKDIVASAIQECAMRAAHANFSSNEQDEGQDEDDPPYNQDGTTNAYAEPGQTVPTGAERPSKNVGQPIDLLSLFSKPQQQAHQDVGTIGRSVAHQPNHITQQPPFVHTADTDFFRFSNSPTSNVQAHSQALPQQNALLSLLKTAKNG